MKKENNLLDEANNIINTLIELEKANDESTNEILENYKRIQCSTEQFFAKAELILVSFIVQYLKELSVLHGYTITQISKYEIIRLLDNFDNICDMLSALGSDSQAVNEYLKFMSLSNNKPLQRAIIETVKQNFVNMYL